MSSPLCHVVLVRPEIPGNTGSIGRTCVALNMALILIRPLGFDLGEKAVRRAGLDYWRHLELVEYASFGEFVAQRKPRAMSFYSKSAAVPFYSYCYERECYLVFGNESEGLSLELRQQYQDQFFSLPLYSKYVRSLNLANAVTAVAYEALRQISYSGRPIV